MASMMPIMKKNYTLYTAGTATNRQRKTSDQTDTTGRKVSIRRQVRSAGTSMSSSPHHQHGASAEALAGSQGRYGNTLTVGMRSRGSAPTFSNTAASHPTTKEKSRLRHTNSVPVGARSKIADGTVNSNLVVVSPSRSSLSSSSSSSSGSTKAIGKFHRRLIMRLRKTLGFGNKDSVHTST